MPYASTDTKTPQLVPANALAIRHHFQGSLQPNYGNRVCLRAHPYIWFRYSCRV